jgi:alpha-galactosidase
MRALIGMVALGVSAAHGGLPAAAAVSATPAEVAHCRNWTAAALGADAEEPVFSFTYDGRRSAELLTEWPSNRSTEALGEQRTRRTVTWTDPRTGLEVRCVSVEYSDFPAVEWTVHLRNTGTTDTPLLEGIQALDTTLRGVGDGQYLLHHAVGSPCEARDYQPLESVVGAGDPLRIGAAGGRSTNSDLSYFSLEMPGREGAIVAVGWPGQWASEWVREESGVHVRIGQELTHFRLHPGEEVRSPLIALLLWQAGQGAASDDWLRAQNLWRRWFIAHNLHRPGGQLPPHMWIGASQHTNMMVGATEENQKQAVDSYLAQGYRPDLWWMDAGWYPCDGDWTCTGTWEPDPARFPHGLEPVTAYLRERGIRSVLWFEPERVRQGTWLATQHPEWLLTGPGDSLLDFGNPEAWKWVLEHVDAMVTSLNLDIYRQDFNMDPLAHWRAHDSPDRQGITENHYVTGMLAYWDELLRRHPDLIYDNCASGGRRNDLESMRRGVPYTKSDYAEDPVGVQGETYGLSLWIPYFAAVGLVVNDDYLSRSRIAQVVGLGIDDQGGQDTSQAPRLLDEWRRTSRCYWGDYWPLTPYSLAADAWLAWQFDLADEGSGVVQAYRRAECPGDSLTVKLRGLDPGATYRVMDLDTREPHEISGSDLMARGLTVSIPTQPGAAIVTYDRVP